MIDTLRAALVIARRDFTALVLSRTFILFLLGPLFPLIVGVAAGGLGDRMTQDAMRPTIGLVLPQTEAAAVAMARARLAAEIGPATLPDVKLYGPGYVPEALLAARDERIVAVLSGTLATPRLTGRAGDIERVRGNTALLVSVARAGKALPQTRLELHAIERSAGSEQQARLLTGRAAQLLLFLLTMLLAGMVLSNMVEEKTNKIIEVLAAAVPVEGIFLGKLIAMLGMSFVGIAVWGAAAALGFSLWIGNGAALPAPAVGWPMFVALAALYFATAYTLLGSLFIGIGAQASTVREVQTLSMPITMAQVVIFFFATHAVDRMGSVPEVAAAIVPFSSPFAMIARAAQSPSIWPHALAIGWQLLWVAIIIRIGVHLFRRNVLKSGRARRPFSGATAAEAHKAA